MKRKFFGLLLFLLIATFASAQTPQPMRAVVDFTKTDGQINRPIFSAQGFMQIYVEKNPLVLDTFMLINPQNTHTRLETYINQMEPENDNDDPNIFNWQKFYPNKMIRFIDETETFNKTLARLGMEPLSLLCYNTNWLKSDNPDYPIKSIPEWTEFASAVIEYYNGSGENYFPNLRYVEIWNEPNMSDFYTGSMQSYFDLFNAASERIHKNYPGVMVGGPALTHAPHCKPEEWMEKFIKQCGKNCDFLSYHPYGESVDKIISDIKRWTDKFRKIPGKEQGKVMLTETDQWTQGWEKTQYVLERQFRLLDISDLILSVHHFCCLAYRESGNYTFGIVDQRGGILEGTFYPYWLFRNLIGNKSYTLKEGAREGDLDLYASSFHQNGKNLKTAVMHNKSASILNLDALLYFEKSEMDRVLSINRVNKDFKGVEKVLIIAAGTNKASINLNLNPGEGIAIDITEPGERFFEFSDMNNQEKPWISAEADKNSLNFLESFEFKARIINTTLKPLSGNLSIKGLPENWKAEKISGNDKIESLKFGEISICTYKITASSLIHSAFFSPYIEFTAKENSLPQSTLPPHSIPYTIELINPISIQALPLPVYAVPGEENKVTLQITNQIDSDVEGKFEFTVPEGFEAIKPAKSFSVKAKKIGRYDFAMKIPATEEEGKKKGLIKIDYLGSSLQTDFEVEIVARKSASNARPLDISKWANIDAAAFNTKRTDFDGAKIGVFVYPADFTPSQTIQNIKGVPYKFLSLDDGNKNAILPDGQMLEIEPGSVAGVSFIGYGHDGKHPGQWKFHYTDGSVETSDSQIPEWCSPEPEGFETAFNAPYRYIPGGPASPACQLFFWTIKTDASKQLKTIELPKMTHAYIYAITLLGE